MLMTGGMQKPETLECLRDDEPEARNKQTWLLCWYLKVIEGRNDAQVINYLNHWIHSKNNGLSVDFDANPAAVYAENKRIVRNFDPLKVGRGRSAPPQRPEREVLLPGQAGRGPSVQLRTVAAKTGWGSGTRFRRAPTNSCLSRIILRGHEKVGSGDVDWEPCQCQMAWPEPGHAEGDPKHVDRHRQGQTT